MRVGGESSILGRGDKMNKMWWKQAGMEMQLETWCGPRHGGLLPYEMESPLVVGECVVSKRREILSKRRNRNGRDRFEEIFS